MATARHIIYVCNSSVYDMPVMDNTFYHGRKLEDLTTEIQDKGIFLSVIAPRRLGALLKLFEKAGGDLAGAKEKNYAKDPRHLVLLNGYALQERPITPKPMPPASSVPPVNLPTLPDQTNNPNNVQFPPTMPTGPRPPASQPQILVNILKNPPVNSVINQPRPGQPPVSVMNNQPTPPSMGQQPPNMVPGPGQQPMNPGQPPNVVRPTQNQGRDIIWRGELEWQEKVKDSDQKITHNVQCQVSTSRDQNGMPEVRSDNWPPKLIMQLIPKSLVQTIGGSYFRQSKSVLFHPQECDSLVALTNVMATGFAGCVHFTGNCDIKVLILLYSNDKKAYLGFIPNDQVSFVERIRTVIQQQKQTHPMTSAPNPNQGMRPGMPGPGPGPNMGGGPPGPSGPMGGPPNNMMGGPTMTSQANNMMGGNVMMNNQGQGGGQPMMMNQGQRMMMSVGPSQQNMIRGQQVMNNQGQYVTVPGHMGGQGGPPGPMQQQRIMQQQGQPMTPGLRQILQQQQQQQQQQPGMMNMMQQGGMGANNQVNFTIFKIIFIELVEFCCGLCILTILYFPPKLLETKKNIAQFLINLQLQDFDYDVFYCDTVIYAGSLLCNCRICNSVFSVLHGLFFCVIVAYSDSHFDNHIGHSLILFQCCLLERARLGILIIHGNFDYYVKTFFLF